MRRATAPTILPAAAPAAPARPMRIAYLLIPQFSMMSFSAALEPLRSANRLSGRQLFEWTLVSVEGDQVAASNGILIAVACRLEDLKDTDLLVVCAGLEPGQFPPGHGLHHHLRRLARHGALVGGISTGAFILAEAGLLAGRCCTVHWEYADGFRSRHPSITLSCDLYVIDRDVFSCSGGTAALDLMLHFVAQAAGAAIAAAVAEQFIHPHIRRRDDHQRLATHARYGVVSPKLTQIIRLMEEALENPADIAALAGRVGLSTRQVERLFQEQLGLPPKAFYLKLRLVQAQGLLRQTIEPILAVAVQCGFASTSHFSHAYKRVFGIAPTRERAGAAVRVSRRASRAQGVGRRQRESR